MQVQGEFNIETKFSVTWWHCTPEKKCIDDRKGILFTLTGYQESLILTRGKRLLEFSSL
jgi:hypothetical protein